MQKKTVHDIEGMPSDAREDCKKVAQLVYTGVICYPRKSAEIQMCHYAHDSPKIVLFDVVFE